MLWVTVDGSRSPSNLSCRCGKLPPDWWRSSAMTGVMIQSCVCSDRTFIYASDGVIAWDYVLYVERVG